MSKFYDKKITQHDGTEKDVLFFEQGNFDGRATDEIIAQNPEAHQVYLDSKDPKKIAEAKAAKVKALEAEIAALKKEK